MAGDTEGGHDGRSTALTRSRDAAIAEVGEEAVYDMVATGMTHREIANALGLDGDKHNAQRAVAKWLRRDPDRYEAAKRASVDAIAEKAGEVYGEEAPESTADAKWRNDRSGYFRWLAELRSGVNRNGINVNLDIGALHLDALKRAGSMEGAQQEREIIEGEYEEVKGESV
jgi:hypothetical protein